tara:strand:+ start:140 stop:388 length:249 start_codon:yes stop_codon:yes gene_type:complete
MRVREFNKMKCFEQSKKYKNNNTTVYFKNMYGDEMMVYLDWDSYDGKKQTLTVDIWNMEKSKKDEMSGNLFFKDLTIAKGKL